MANGIHVWTAFLTASANQLRGLYETLSPDERKRAEALRFEKHRTCFVIGRGLLRSILGWYLGQTARDLVFRYGAKGKPSLASSTQTLHFNLAHSGDFVIYAISESSELGVDVESMRSFPDFESVARNFFSAGECADLFSLPADKRLEAFFNCWTRKEAYVKAIGDGLSVPLDRFQVSLIPDQPAAFFKLHDFRYPTSRWSLVHLMLSEGYVGAVAIPLPSATLQRRAFYNADGCLTHLRSIPCSPSPHASRARG